MLLRFPVREDCAAFPPDGSFIFGGGFDFAADKAAHVCCNAITSARVARRGLLQESRVVAPISCDALC
jgi:hypothetical protein